MKTLLAPFVFCAASSCFADGLDFDGHRLARSERVSVLNLTSVQINELKSLKDEPFVWKAQRIVLTPEQQSQLVKEAGFEPENVSVYTLKTAKQVCTCKEVNVAFRIRQDKIEIPHRLLGQDLEDRILRNRKEQQPYLETAKKIEQGDPGNPIPSGTSDADASGVPDSRGT